MGTAGFTYGTSRGTPDRYVDIEGTGPLTVTSAGAPTSGAFVKGDLALDDHGVLWICRSPGSPGSWEAVGAKELAVAEKSVTQQITGTTVTDVTGLSIIVTSRGRPYYVEYVLSQVKQNVAGSNYIIQTSVRNASNTVYDGSYTTELMIAGTTTRTRMHTFFRVDDAAGTEKTYKVSLATASAGGDVSVEGSAVRSYIRAMEA